MPLPHSFIIKLPIMILIVVAVLLCQCVNEAVSESDSTVLKFNNNVNKDGYEFEFLTSDGIYRREKGTFPDNKDSLQVNGEFSFNFPNGSPFYLVFTADEKGYRPKVRFGGPIGADDHSAGAQGGLGAAGAEPEFMIANRINYEPKSISSSAIASITGGGIGK